MDSLVDLFMHQKKLKRVILEGKEQCHLQYENVEILANCLPQLPNLKKLTLDRKLLFHQISH